MDFELSDEQRLLGDSARRFGQDNYDFAVWRARVAAGQGFDRGCWAQMAELGWLALTVPEALGGLGGSPVDAMVLMEAAGRFLMLEPLVSSGVIAPRLLAHAAPERRQGLIDSLVAGTALFALADAEPQGRFDLADISTRAVRSGDEFILTGAKSHALDGGDADGFFVPARTGGTGTDPAGVSLFLVPADAAGLQVEPMRGMDHRINARLDLREVRVGRDALIGDEGEAMALIGDAVDHAVAARLAEAVGAADAAYEMTLDHLRTRHQFGRPLAAFQALQHRAVDMAIACEEARSMAYLATLSMDRPQAERAPILAAAKARVSQTTLYVARQAIQLHGGVGFSEELAVAHYLKRLTMIDMAFGNAAHQRGRFVALSRAGEPA